MDGKLDGGGEGEAGGFRLLLSLYMVNRRFILERRVVNSKE